MSLALKEEHVVEVTSVPSAPVTYRDTRPRYSHFRYKVVARGRRKDNGFPMVRVLRLDRDVSPNPYWTGEEFFRDHTAIA